jgi:hypothetical protein
VPIPLKPIATWDPDLDCWIVSDDDTESLFSVPSLVFSETFPVSGMTVGGTAYELPTSEPHTDGSECSLLPTRTAKDTQASRGSTPSDITLTDAVVRTDMGQRPNPRHSCRPLARPTPRGQDTTATVVSTSEPP